MHIVLDFNCLFTLLFWLKKRYLTISSVASGQSRSPSHLHLLVMQYPLPQAKSFCRSHLFSGHFRSSLPSPQSSSWSHNHFFWMQLPLSQVNSSDVQVWSKKIKLLGSIQKWDTWPYQLANKWEIILLLLRKVAAVKLYFHISKFFTSSFIKISRHIAYPI